MPFHDLRHPLGCGGIDRIEQASALEQPAGPLVLKAILKIPVVVLIWLRMHDNHVIDPRLLDKIQVRRERLRWRTIRRRRMIRKAFGLEKVDMGIDKLLSGSGERGGHRPRARQKLSPVQHRSNYLAP